MKKNTIVKCKAHPNCLFNHNGICDNYVINISADGRCESYIETELVGSLIQDPIEIGLAFKKISKQMDIQRGQRAEGNFYDDACDISFLREDLEKIQKTLEQDSIPCTMKIAELNKPNKNKNIIKIPPMPKEDREIMNDIGYIPSTYPNYDECWICVHGGNSNTYCNLSVIPMIGPDGKCCRFSRRVE